MLITADTVVTGSELLRPGWIEIDRRPGASGRCRARRRGRPTSTWARSPWCPGSWTCTCTAAGAGRSRRPTGRDGDATARRRAAPPARHHDDDRLAGHRPSRPSCCGRSRAMAEQVRGRSGRRHPSGGALAGAEHAAAPMSCPRCATRIRPSSTGCWRPAAGRSGWSPWPPSGPAAWPRSGGSWTPARWPRSGTPTPPTSRPGRRSTPARPSATHLFNAMRPVHHREPGPVLALLEDPRVTVETDHRRRAPAPGAVPGREPQRRPGPGRAGHRRDGRGRDGRRRLPARVAGRRRRRRRRQGGRHRHHRRQHRDDGPGLPVRRRSTAGCPATRRCWPPSGSRRSTRPGRWACRRPDSVPVRRPTWWCSTPR